MAHLNHFLAKLLYLIFTHLKLCIATAIHNFKWVKSAHICLIWDQTFANFNVKTVFCRINLWRRIFKVDSPLRNLCCYFAARYIGHGDVFPQTLAANIIIMGAPLILNAFNCKHHRQNVDKVQDDGVVDTLRVLLHSHDFNLRHTRPHTLFTLLTRF